MKSLTRIAVLAVFAGVAYLLSNGLPTATNSATEEISTPSSRETGATPAINSDARLQQAFQRRESNLQIAGEGVVVKILKDDTHGSPHQRFLLRTATGQTLLVAHNIELAPRIVDIAEGDTVRFYGEYEWNEKGGVLHWTHHDPRGKHPGGWLEHRGQRYE
ncbi:MAG: DUF3465 domain-containing protein [Pseudomonadota bacterium]